MTISLKRDGREETRGTWSGGERGGGEEMRDVRPRSLQDMTLSLSHSPTHVGSPPRPTGPRSHSRTDPKRPQALQPDSRVVLALELVLPERPNAWCTRSPDAVAGAVRVRRCDAVPRVRKAFAVLLQPQPQQPGARALKERGGGFSHCARRAGSGACVADRVLQEAARGEDGLEAMKRPGHPDARSEIPGFLGTLVRPPRCPQDFGKLLMECGSPWIVVDSGANWFVNIRVVSTRMVHDRAPVFVVLYRDPNWLCCLSTPSPVHKGELVGVVARARRARRGRDGATCATHARWVVRARDGKCGQGGRRRGEDKMRASRRRGRHRIWRKLGVDEVGVTHTTAGDAGAMRARDARRGDAGDGKRSSPTLNMVETGFADCEHPIPRVDIDGQKDAPASLCGVHPGRNEVWGDRAAQGERVDPGVTAAGVEKHLSTRACRGNSRQHVGRPSPTPTPSPRETETGRCPSEERACRLPGVSVGVGGGEGSARAKAGHTSASRTVRTRSGPAEAGEQTWVKQARRAMRVDVNNYFVVGAPEGVIGREEGAREPVGKCDGERVLVGGVDVEQLEGGEAEGEERTTIRTTCQMLLPLPPPGLSYDGGHIPWLEGRGSGTLPTTPAVPLCIPRVALQGIGHGIASRLGSRARPAWSSARLPKSHPVLKDMYKSEVTKAALSTSVTRATGDRDVVGMLSGLHEQHTPDHCITNSGQIATILGLMDPSECALAMDGAVDDKPGPSLDNRFTPTRKTKEQMTKVVKRGSCPSVTPIRGARVAVGNAHTTSYEPQLNILARTRGPQASTQFISSNAWNTPPQTSAALNNCLCYHNARFYGRACGGYRAGMHTLPELVRARTPSETVVRAPPHRVPAFTAARAVVTARGCTHCRSSYERVPRPRRSYELPQAAPTIFPVMNVARSHVRSEPRMPAFTAARAVVTARGCTHCRSSYEHVPRLRRSYELPHAGSEYRALRKTAPELVQAHTPMGKCIYITNGVYYVEIVSRVVEMSDIAARIYLECPVNGCESVEVDLDPYDVALVFPRPNIGQMVRIRGFVEQDNAFECEELITAQEAMCTDGLIVTTPRMALFRNGPWQLEEKQVGLRDRIWRRCKSLARMGCM
ncbi:uncharacterized protein BXZ73DRAFT_79163 [Epithele typhae]|uniref:uncharacterized protein n=1 Tax=Epithele typhae TaxID=378194 RepID=UPI002007940D|nr:uncharacterized protein BXZ73DRAFT_79163 [Epithele typhae]KAH9925061.1 hypothetical protein BXZ73DRAFT_79163 [Epithele typhae]